MVNYRIASQNRNNYLSIEIIGKNLYLLKSAIDIVNDVSLMCGFSPQDAAIIGFIASEMSNRVVRL